MANWFSYVEVAAAALAGAAWYLFPELGAWPLALGLAPWVVRLAATGRAGRMTRFAPPLFLFLIMAVGGVWAAYDPAAAWAKFWLIVGAILLFYAFAHGLLAAHADEGRSGEAYAWMLALMGATVTVYFLATHDWGQFTAELAFVPELGRRLQAPLPPLPGHRLNPNVVGGLLAMSIPFTGLAFCLAWARGRWRRAAAAMALLGLALFGLLMTTSLGAWLGLAAALVLAGVWTLAGWWVRPRRRRWLVLGAMVVVVLLAIGVALLRPEAVVAAAGPLPGTGGIGRLSMYRSALPLVADYPFVGGGLNGFDMLYSTYAFLTHVGFIPHAHNVYLNVAIEQGLPALFALGWMWGLAVVAGWRDAADGRVRPLLGVGLLALVTMAVHGLVDDAFYGSRALLLLFVPLAFVLPFPSARAVDRKRWASVVVATGVGLTLLAAVLLWRPLLSLAYGNLAAVQQSRAELSVYEWPEWPIQDAVRREVDLSRPVANFERALSLNPENGPAGRRLGQIELSLGEYGAALEHLRRAYRQMPWDNGTRQLYGEALIVTGSVGEGATLWDGVWATQGQLDGRVYWYRHIGDIERLEAVQAAAEQAE